jgi:hypothetical protein
MLVSCWGGLSQEYQYGDVGEGGGSLRNHHRRQRHWRNRRVAFGS